MDSFYKQQSLALILAISKALEKMEEKDYAAAEKLLRDGWDEAAGVRRSEVFILR